MLGWGDSVGLTVLMGGELREQRHLEPEKPRVVIGIQDMLLSRALNRGYALSPFMWPVEYGLLNNDCLWAMDEPQLMGDALATTAQLAGLRENLSAFGPVRSVWMSATIDADWLDTPDHPAPAAGEILELSKADFDDESLSKRRNAVKKASEAKGVEGGSVYEKKVAALAREKHRKGTLTLVIVNTVERARKVFGEIVKGINADRKKAERDSGKRKAAQGDLFQSDSLPKVLLSHSRFRRKDREATMRASALSGANICSGGEIIVATQTVEAGVDVSARVLISEIAPWASMVQRLGRCNRAGEFDSEGGGEFVWLNRAKKREAAPYELASVEKAAEIMRGFEGGSASPAALESQKGALGEAEYAHVIRRRDVIDSFDNSANLSGGYTDISRYVRSDGEKSAFAFWRDLGDSDSEGCAEILSAQGFPRADELVGVPIGEFRSYMNAKKPNGKARRRLRIWDFAIGEWSEAAHEDVRPGASVMLDAKLGGYSEDRGWDAANWEAVNPVEPASGETEAARDGHESDPLSVGMDAPATLSDHSRHAEREAAGILGELEMDGSDPEIAEAVKTAALFYDVGKVHPAFQTMLRGGEAHNFGDAPLAKSAVGAKARIGNARRQFRHEIGSAMAVLQNADNLSEGEQRDLAAYLAMSHHGKVRLRLQPLARGADEIPSKDFLLGFDMKSAETLDAVDLGEGFECSETRVDVSPAARMGSEGGGDGRSWQDRALEVLERRGPFSLAFLEAITRAADHRASARERSQ